MSAAGCSLSVDELAAQLERYREIGRFAAAVEHEPGRVVVRFAGAPPSALIEQALEVERGCCPFYEIDYQPAIQRLAISVDHPDRYPGVDAIAHALTEGDTRTMPGVPSCCSPAELERCCEPRNKQDCCGQPSTGAVAAAPSRCGCRA